MKPLIIADVSDAFVFVLKSTFLFNIVICVMDNALIISIVPIARVKATNSSLSKKVAIAGAEKYNPIYNNILNPKFVKNIVL